MNNLRETWVRKYSHLEKMSTSARGNPTLHFEMLASMLELYDKMTKKYRSEVHELLAEWLVSDNNTHRYDAAFIIRERNIRILLPAITSAIKHFENSLSPEILDEVCDLNKLKNHLEQ